MKNKILRNIQNHKYLYIICISIAIVSLGILLKNNNPENTNIFPPCLVYNLTGIKCAGCGMTRAIHNLLNFEIKKAITLNPLLFVYIIYLIYVVIKYVVLKRKFEKVSINNYVHSLYIILIITISFMILRNIIII